MKPPRNDLPAQVFALIGTLLASAAAAQSSAPPATPFGDVAGSWSGSGTVRLENGSTERLRCQAVYQLVPSGGTLRQNLRCSSDGYNVDLRTTVIAQGASLSGTWVEITKKVEGRISGQIARGQIQAVAQGSGLTATLAVTTRGNQQTLSIKSRGNDKTDISIVLRRVGVRAPAPR